MVHSSYCNIIQHLSIHLLFSSKFSNCFMRRKYVNQMNTPFTCPPNSHRLFDLIHIFDAKYRPAFYFAFSDTLVTTSLDIVCFFSFLFFSFHSFLPSIISSEFFHTLNDHLLILIGFQNRLFQTRGSLPCCDNHWPDYREVRNYVWRRSQQSSRLTSTER